MSFFVSKVEIPGCAGPCLDQVINEEKWALPLHLAMPFFFSSLFILDLIFSQHGYRLLTLILVIWKELRRIYVPSERKS